MKPESYREQDGCWNCKWGCKHIVWGEPYRWFCCHGSTPQPMITMSYEEAYNANGGNTALQQHHRERDKLSQWISRQEETNPWGICDEWEKEDE